MHEWEQQVKRDKREVPKAWRKQHILPEQMKMEVDAAERESVQQSELAIREKECQAAKNLATTSSQKLNQQGRAVNRQKVKIHQRRLTESLNHQKTEAKMSEQRSHLEVLKSMRPSFITNQNVFLVVLPAMLAACIAVVHSLTLKFVLMGQTNSKIDFLMPDDQQLLQELQVKFDSAVAVSTRHPKDSSMHKIYEWAVALAEEKLNSKKEAVDVATKLAASARLNLAWEENGAMLYVPVVAFVVLLVALVIFLLQTERSRSAAVWASSIAASTKILEDKKMLAKAKLVPLQETLVQLQANHQQLQDQHEQAMAKCKEAQEIKAKMAHIHGNLHKKHDADILQRVGEPPAPASASDWRGLPRKYEQYRIKKAGYRRELREQYQRGELKVAGLDLTDVGVKNTRYCNPAVVSEARKRAELRDLDLLDDFKALGLDVTGVDVNNTASMMAMVRREMNR